MPRTKKTLKSSSATAGSSSSSPASPKKATSVKTSSARSGGSFWLTPVAIIVAGIFIAGAVFAKDLIGFDKNESGEPAVLQEDTVQDTQVLGEDSAEKPTPPTPPADYRAEVPEGDNPVLGVITAPVTIVEFSEFACPFCGKFSAETLPQIKENYIDTGKVRYVERDYLVHGATAERPALAAECARAQGLYWEMHDKLFEDSVTWSAETTAEGASAVFAQYALELGLDIAQFDVCYNSDWTGAQEETKEGQELAQTLWDIGVLDRTRIPQRDMAGFGTPTFFINGEMLVGAQPYSVFVTAIEKALAEAEAEE